VMNHRAIVTMPLRGIRMANDRRVEIRAEAMEGGLENPVRDCSIIGRCSITGGVYREDPVRDIRE
jgi:hypothetical protein